MPDNSTSDAAIQFAVDFAANPLIHGSYASDNTPVVPVERTRQTTFSIARQFASHLEVGRKSRFIRWLKQMAGGNAPSYWSATGYMHDCRLQPFEFKDHFNRLMESLHASVHLVQCEDCSTLLLEGDGTLVRGDDIICDRCLGEYIECASCCEFHRPITMIYVEGWGRVCENCRDNTELDTCVACGVMFRFEDLSYNEDDENYYCEEHMPMASNCKPKNLNFEFPALCTPEKSVEADRLVIISVGEGDVSIQGLKAIRTLIYQKTSLIERGVTMAYGFDVPEIENDNIVERIWQNKEGNFSKRIAKHLLVRRGMKLTEDAMAEIGNIAKAHSGKAGVHYLTITRNLDLPRSQFVNADSCWWGGQYSYSRCELKAWHGFGVRTFNDKTLDRPISRAWLVPLTASAHNPPRFSPCEKLPADAYVLFNAYGIDQLPYARMIAGMTGKSYKKMPDFRMEAYINAGGVLIAEQSVCDATTRIILPEMRTCSRTCSGRT